MDSWTPPRVAATARAEGQRYDLTAGGRVVDPPMGATASVKPYNSSSSTVHSSTSGRLNGCFLGLVPIFR